MTAPAAADLERNRIHRDIEGRVLKALRDAYLPLTTSQAAKAAHVTGAQARRALTQLVADGRARKIWDEPRETDAYEPAERP